MKSRAAVIVLAAGRGTRFRGLQHKLAQPLGDSNVLGTTIGNALAARMPVTVVTTESLADLVSEHVATRDMVVLPSDGTASSHGLGMGYSIAAGVAARSEASGWLVLPADMPMVQPATLRAVAREMECYSIAYAQYKGRRGHPVGFAAELYSELVMLTGDEGARRLIARYPSHAVDVDDPGALMDIETEQDLVQIQTAHQAWPLRAAH